MEEAEGQEPLTNRSVEAHDAPASKPSSGSRTGMTLAPQIGGGTCATCGGAMENPNGHATTYSYVYALGRVEPRFPSLAVEKEFAQATGRAETAGLTDRQALQAVLSAAPEPLPGAATVLCVDD